MTKLCEIVGTHTGRWRGGVDVTSTAILFKMTTLQSSSVRPGSLWPALLMKHKSILNNTLHTFELHPNSNWHGFCSFTLAFAVKRHQDEWQRGPSGVS